MLNAISVDVEEYFQVEAFAGAIDAKSWSTCESRVERSIDRILDLFQNNSTKGTFFILGWIAERFPSIVRRIAESGHEIGCHGFGHQRIQRQTPDQFRQDIQSARNLLTSIVHKPVHCYRAPSFSIAKPTLWALDILVEEGFRIDSSIFPIRHDLYGMPDGDRFTHWEVSPAGRRIFEFPPSTIRLLNNNWGVAGGGYLRLAPYSFTRWAIRRINDKELQPVMVYFHPWELDPAQPRISAPLRSTLRHYTNLGGTQRKIELLLNDFHFDTVSEVCSRLSAYRKMAENMQNVRD
jgi:polysaccharide deacetylase family protein (PEP-CTERM system associated)